MIMNEKVLKISIPSNNVKERQYIISVLLGDVLNINYRIEVDDKADCTSLYFEDKIFIIQDHFWNNNKSELSYFQLENIPNIVRFASSNHIKDLPIIYGVDYYEENAQKIICGIDIFASAFFCLTRWEEFLLGREKTGKCDESKLLCVRNNCTKRAIVNEYLDWLKVTFDKMGIVYSANSFRKIMVTHDVDRCYLSSFAVLINNLFGLAFKDKQYKKAITSLRNYLIYKIKGQSPFDCYDELMDYSDKHGLKNYFYFKACLSGESGWTYSVNEVKVAESIKNILRRGHYVGIHPSESTFDNNSQFVCEYQRLCAIVGENVIRGGRNHGLFYNMNTFNQWNNLFQYDSGLGYQNFNGFRCGICYPYHMFDIVKREKMDILEIPFVAMDSVAMRNKWTPEETLIDVKETINIVNKFQGMICINWHSNLINAIERKHHKDVYFKIVEYLANLL